LTKADRPDSLEDVDPDQQRDRQQPNGAAVDRIVLAREPTLRLGPLLIDPPHRHIAHEDGREELVEPRVMQVLVALVRADGAILSRDDLIQCCWDGRIVGDDAINRVLSRLRRSAAGIGQGIFRIETLTKVGYRLVTGEAGVRTASALQMPAAATTARAPRWTLWVAIAAAGFAIGLATLAFLPWNRAAPVPSVAVLSENPGPDAADYLVRIAGERRGERLQGRATLSERVGGTLLWSTELDRPASEQVDLRQQMTAKIGAVLLCALRGSDPRGVRLDVVTLRLFLTYCDRLDDGVDEPLLATIGQVTERAPAFARGWAALALTEASLGWPDAAWHPDQPRKRAYREAALGHLRQARALDPTLPDNYLTEVHLSVEPGRWRHHLAILDRGLAVAPDPTLHITRGDTLFSVGRIADAVGDTRRAVALDPLSPNVRCGAALGLAHGGDFESARREIAECDRLWPGSWQTRYVRFVFELNFGDPRAALAMLGDPRNLTFAGAPDSRDRLRSYLRARTDPTAANIDRALAAYSESVKRSPDEAMRYLQALATFGRVDDAYRLISAPDLDLMMRRRTDILFFPNMRPIRNDRRFMPLAYRLGLVRFWQESGQWPDFCSEPGVPYDCRVEARRLTSGR
jgi:DNA-binding winged helix-turn-helix (wHTH) protein/tetratricopeptide (TPR) repeat protein